MAQRAWSIVQREESGIIFSPQRHRDLREITFFICRETAASKAHRAEGREQKSDDRQKITDNR